MRNVHRGVPVILQAEQAECGLAAIAMVARYFGHQLDLATLRRQFAYLDDGPTLQSQLAIADALGLIARPVTLKLAEINQLILPAILHWEFDHFVVATRVRRRGVVIHDPAVGRRFISKAVLGDSFTGVAVEFARAGHFRKLASGRTPGIMTFVRSVRGLARYLGLMLVLLLATQLLALAPPVATQLLIDEVVLAQDRKWLYRVLAGVALVMVTMLGIDTLRRWVALYTGTRLAADITAAVVQHLFRLSVTTIERRPVGDLISRIESLKPIRAALTETFLNSVVYIVILVTTLAVMMVYSVPLMLLSVAALLLGALLQAALLPATRATNLEAVVASAQSSQSLIETLRGFRATRALGLGAQRLAHWQRAFTAATNASAKQTRLNIINGLGQGLVTTAEQLLFLAIGIGGVVNKQITLGILFAFLSLRGRLNIAAVQLLGAVREIYLLRSHIERVGEIVLEDADARSPPAALRQRVKGAIVCRNVSFQYPGGARVLSHFSCSIEVGESVVIAGRSGAGKTTLLNLLSAGLQPDAGLLLFDDSELPLWDSDALRRQFGIVLQQDQLFQGSVADNISCFESVPDIGRIREAAMLAAIWADIQSLPMNIHTPVASTGCVLSGGQVQRVLLARALYREPPILFLDEATSHLDKDTETLVLTNLNSLGITIVSVAHSENALKFSGRRLEL